MAAAETSSSFFLSFFLSSSSSSSSYSVAERQTDRDRETERCRGKWSDEIRLDWMFFVKIFPHSRQSYITIFRNFLCCSGRCHVLGGYVRNRETKKEPKRGNINTQFGSALSLYGPRHKKRMRAASSLSTTPNTFAKWPRAAARPKKSASRRPPPRRKKKSPGASPAALREEGVVVVSSRRNEYNDDDFDDTTPRGWLLEENQNVSARKKKTHFALVASTTVAFLLCANAVSSTSACRAAQVVDWLASGADASPEELVRIMKESAKEDWDPTTVTSAPDVTKKTTKEEDGGRQSEGESDAASDEVWEKNVNANQLGVGGGVQKSDLSSDGYDIDAPILSSDTGWRLGKLGVILIGADFVTAFIMGKSVLGVAKGLEKGEGEKRDWKETVAEMVMDKLKAKAEVLKEQEEEE